MPLEAAELNRADGFSPGAALLFWMPAADLVRSNAPAINDIGRSLERDSPIVIVDARSGKRVPLWAERDLLSAPGSQSLIVRPAIDFIDGHRYVVAVRHLVDADGNPLPPSPAFAAYRDGTCTTDATFESRRPAMEAIFKTLRSAGIGSVDLQLAWDFTVASTRSTTGRMLHIRDDAFKALGSKAPSFTVTSVQENPSPQFRRRIQGTFEVPLYLTGDGSPGQRFALGPDGLPQRQAQPFTATFTCNLPNSAVPGPARMSMYGHGLLGDQSEVNGSLVRPMAATYNIAYCATDWIGMAEEDVANAIAVLQDLSQFATLADRLQQGLLNFLFLGRLMKHPDGFASNDAFKIDGAPALNTRELYFDGNSQGAILGGALCAVARDFRRCVLGEAGMNYSTLLNRSVDFDLYKLVLDSAYPDPFTQLLVAQHRPDAVGSRRDQRLRAAPDQAFPPPLAAAHRPAARRRRRPSGERVRPPGRGAHRRRLRPRAVRRARPRGRRRARLRHPAAARVLVAALGLLPVRHGLPAVAAGQRAAARRPRPARRHPEDSGGAGAEGHVLASARLRERRLQCRSLHRPPVLILDPDAAATNAAPG